MIEMTAITGEKWMVDGINMSPSDSIYQRIIEVINSGKITQKSLQGTAGHNAPVMIDFENRRILFERF